MLKESLILSVSLLIPKNFNICLYEAGEKGNILITKVCHITSAHPRYDRRILLKECVSLANAGYDTYLIINDDEPDESFEGVKIRSTNYVASNRLNRFIFSKRKLLECALEVDAEIYHFHDPDLLPMMNKIKRLGKKVIFDSHENIPKQILDKAWIPSPIRKLVAWLYEIYEKTSVSKASAAISVTPMIVERFLNFQKNTYLVTNYPILSLEPPKLDNSMRTIGFAGGVTSQYNHDVVIEAIEQIEKVTYLVAGRGGNEYIERLMRYRGWNKVEYLGQISPFQVTPRIYQLSSVGICLHMATQAEDQGSLGVIKLFEMMECGLPVVCTDYPLWEDIIEKYDCGICVDPRDVVAVRDAIQYLLDNPDRAAEIGNNGRKAVELEYNWGSQEKILLNLYSKLTGTD